MGGKLKLHDCPESKSAISAASLYMSQESSIGQEMWAVKEF